MPFGRGRMSSVVDDEIKNKELSKLEAIETQEWLDSLDHILQQGGPGRVRRLLRQLQIHAQEAGVKLPFTANTPYINTIPAEEQQGDIIYFQGHASPGIYARAFLEGRLSVEQLQNFRNELHPGGGLSSYPHPWLMPNFWEFPTVSMGLSPIMAIYQARFNRYLEDRELKKPSDAKVWAFVGDGEVDEPETLGAITLGSREKLDNLIFVINCNLQRLDGPVRGNGKIIQELEAIFRGAGWNVIKVIWGGDWDPLLAKDHDGILVKVMEENVDGQYQKYIVETGKYIRERFFGADPRLLEMVKHLSDEQLQKLNRGGHDPEKVYAAYKAAVEHKGSPTVILAKTIKGYGLGESGEGKNITHQQKKLNEEELREFRSRFGIPISDEDVSKAPFYKPPDDSPEMKYLHARRRELGGYIPNRMVKCEPIKTPLYELFDIDTLLYYKEAKDGQILEEGITEAGSMSSFIAAGTAYATHGINTIPFFTFYSMFGLQRIGDLVWAAGDMRCRGFLVGATSGRTTLAGEGLQHQDGHSHLLAYPVPNLKAYDPAFAYEVAVIIQDGIRRMYEEQQDIFYYLTVMNEPYVQPPMPDGVKEGILKGMYKFKASENKNTRLHAHLFGSGAILNETLKAQKLLGEKYGVAADVWSVTSYKELYRDGHEAERWNMLHPSEIPRVPYITQCLQDEPGVFIAASDFSKALPDSIYRWFPKPLVSLGTDGFGRGG